MSYIKEAVYEQGQWQLHDIHRSVITPTEGTTQYQASGVREHLVSPHILQVALSDPDDLSMQGLYEYAGYLEDNGLNNKPYLLNFWKKASQPLAMHDAVVCALYLWSAAQCLDGFALISGDYNGF